MVRRRDSARRFVAPPHARHSDDLPRNPRRGAQDRVAHPRGDVRDARRYGGVPPGGAIRAAALTAGLGRRRVAPVIAVLTLAFGAAKPLYAQSTALERVVSVHFHDLSLHDA